MKIFEISLDKLKLFTNDLVRFLKLNNIQFLGFNGNLGVGKTTLIRYLVNCLCENTSFVSSPSFTIIKEYNCLNRKIYHLDIYRLDDFFELEYIGLYELFNNNDYIFVEWFNKFKLQFLNYLDDILVIDINYTNIDNIRELELEYLNKGKKLNYDIFSNRYI